MRKLLLASAAVLGATSGLAFAQQPASFNTAPAIPTPNPNQGQLVGPYGAGPAVNNNNNSWGIANTPTGSVAAGPLSTVYAPNVIAVPTPGTVVIRLNGRVEVDMTGNWTSADQGKTVSAAGVSTPNGFKLNPLGISSYVRLYPGFDGVSANGLRYGASVEIRENFGAGDRTFAVSGLQTSTPNGTVNAPFGLASVANSPSANSSTQTLFVRRAFTYIASDKVGLVRLGQTDGVLGLFDNCIFTSQCWDAGVGNFNGGAMQATGPGGPNGPVAIPFVWLAQAGADYANNKVVYLSPQFYGFDFGAQYAPNMGNTYQMGGLGVNCNQASATCIANTSGNDSTRWYNQVGVGLRFQQTFGAVDFKAYGFYETAGKDNLTSTSYVTPTSVLLATAGTNATITTTSANQLRYDNLSFYKAGTAITALNTTFAFDYIGGAVNGQLAMRPTGGAPMNAFVTGLTYANGPWTAGIEYANVQSQGAAQLTGFTQRNEQEFATGGSYKVAPGLQLVGEYMYTFRHQGGFNFNTGAIAATATKGGGVSLNSTGNGQAQGVLFATVLTW
jgi:Gram-negative porin